MEAIIENNTMVSIKNSERKFRAKSVKNFDPSTSVKIYLHFDYAVTNRKGELLIRWKSDENHVTNYLNSGKVLYSPKVQQQLHNLEGVKEEIKKWKEDDFFYKHQDLFTVKYV